MRRRGSPGRHPRRPGRPRPTWRTSPVPPSSASTSVAVRGLVSPSCGTHEWDEVRCHAVRDIETGVSCTARRRTSARSRRRSNCHGAAFGRVAGTAYSPRSRRGRPRQITPDSWRFVRAARVVSRALAPAPVDARVARQRGGPRDRGTDWFTSKWTSPPACPAFTMVGLPDASVRESRDRVRSAIRNCGLHFPPQRITVNLAPADQRKEGTSFDLPIALGVLAAAGALPDRHDSRRGRARRIVARRLDPPRARRAARGDRRPPPGISTG